jgi:hypothetical protein
MRRLLLHLAAFSAITIISVPAVQAQCSGGGCPCRYSMHLQYQTIAVPQYQPPVTRPPVQQALRVPVQPVMPTYTRPIFPSTAPVVTRATTPVPQYRPNPTPTSTVALKYTTVQETLHHSLTQQLNKSTQNLVLTTRPTISVPQYRPNPTTTSAVLKTPDVVHKYSTVQETLHHSLTQLVHKTTDNHLAVTKTPESHINVTRNDHPEYRPGYYPGSGTTAELKPTPTPHALVTTELHRYERQLTTVENRTTIEHWTVEYRKLEHLDRTKVENGDRIVAHHQPDPGHLNTTQKSPTPLVGNHEPETKGSIRWKNETQVKVTIDFNCARCHHSTAEKQTTLAVQIPTCSRPLAPTAKSPQFSGSPVMLARQTPPVPQAGLVELSRLQVSPGPQYQLQPTPLPTGYTLSTLSRTATDSGSPSITSVWPTIWGSTAPSNATLRLASASPTAGTTLGSISSSNLLSNKPTTSPDMTDDSDSLTYYSDEQLALLDLILKAPTPAPIVMLTPWKEGTASVKLSMSAIFEAPAVPAVAIPR